MYTSNTNSVPYWNEDTEKRRTMSTNTEDLQEVEVSIDYAKKCIATRDALEKLTNNPQFKEIVLDGYFKEEAIRLVLLKSDPEMGDDASQKQIINGIDAIGAFRSYLRVIMQHGANMEKTLKADEATREEILSEQL